MSKAQRFRLDRQWDEWFDEYEDRLIVHEDGEYVLYEDYEKLLKDRDRIKKVMKDLRAELWLQNEKNKKLLISKNKHKERHYALAYGTDEKIGSSNVSGKEPSHKIIREKSRREGTSHYQARETLREQAYGGKPPNGHQSWGDYWKSY